MHPAAGCGPPRLRASRLFSLALHSNGLLAAERLEPPDV